MKQRTLLATIGALLLSTNTFANQCRILLVSPSKKCVATNGNVINGMSSFINSGLAGKAVVDNFTRGIDEATPSLDAKNRTPATSLNACMARARDYYDYCLGGQSDEEQNGAYVRATYVTGNTTAGDLSATTFVNKSTWNQESCKVTVYGQSASTLKQIDETADHNWQHNGGACINRVTLEHQAARYEGHTPMATRGIFTRLLPLTIIMTRAESLRARAYVNDDRLYSLNQLVASVEARSLPLAQPSSKHQRIYQDDRPVDFQRLQNAFNQILQTQNYYSWSYGFDETSINLGTRDLIVTDYYNIVGYQYDPVTGEETNRYFSYPIRLPDTGIFKMMARQCAADVRKGTTASSSVGIPLSCEVW